MENEYSHLKRSERTYDVLHKLGIAIQFGGIIVGDIAIAGCIADFAGHPFFQESTLLKMIWEYTIPPILLGGILSYGGYTERERCRGKLSNLEGGRQ